MGFLKNVIENITGVLSRFTSEDTEYIPDEDALELGFEEQGKDMSKKDKDMLRKAHAKLSSKNYKPGEDFIEDELEVNQGGYVPIQSQIQTFSIEEKNRIKQKDELYRER